MEGAFIAAVICAAGSSSRMGGVKKEYLSLGEEGVTVLGAVVRAFAAVPSVGVIVIAVPEGGEAAAREVLPPDYLTASKPKIVFVEGGKTRQASVFNALSLLGEYRLRGEYNPRYVLIHDGARPRVNPSLILDVIKAVKNYGAVIPLIPLTDTPKECDMPWELQQETESGPAFITRHMKRANAGLAQTPQGFKFPEILQAHEKAAAAADEEFTDDAEVWGKFCGLVAVIPGDPENRKITYQEDL